MKPTPNVFILLIFLTVAFAQTGESIGNDSDNMTPDSGGYESGSNGSINEHMLSNQSYNIRIVLDHIFISRGNDSLEVSETVVFRNEGSEIYYSKGNHTFFAISTPPGIKNLKTQAMECCLVEEEGAVLMDPMQPIKPGDNFEMAVSYTLPLQGSEYVFNKSTMYNTSALSIFVDKKGGVGIPGSYETITLHGNKYDVTSFNDLSTGEMVHIPIKLTEVSNYLYAGAGLVFLLSVGLVYHFRGKILRKKEPTLEELELEKRRIFQAILGFEKHAGDGKSEEYRRLMEEYRQKAVQIFIKIDKIKAKLGREQLKE